MGPQRAWQTGRWRALALSLGLLAGCSSGASPVLTVTGHQPFINGDDNRREYFEVTDPAERAAFESFSVALMTDGNAEALLSHDVQEIQTWGALNHLCNEEPFHDQPSASFCSGVLVDWDLVLTSGHCVDLVPLEQLRVVLGYYYSAPGQLAVSASDVYGVAEILAARRDPGLVDERLDFAWLRLEGPVHAPHRPASLYTRAPGPALGDAIISLGAGGGVPIKLDDGGHVQETRPDVADYFVADTDTSEGSSGGGAYASDLALVGTLARGAPDFVPNPSGACQVSDKGLNPLDAREQFTYAYRSVEGLCAVAPERWVCNSSCEQPCSPPLAPPEQPEQATPENGCSIAAPRARRWPGALALLLTAALLDQRRRRRPPR